MLLFLSVSKVILFFWASLLGLFFFG
jgi:hypothetical protein